MPNRVLPSSLARLNIEDGGAFRIRGAVSEETIYGAYKVRLYDRKTGRCIFETTSKTNGEYNFSYIANRPNGYFVIAFDHGSNPLNAAIADLVTPEPMP